jgi:hypothetical protein
LLICFSQCLGLVQLEEGAAVAPVEQGRIVTRSRRQALMPIAIAHSVAAISASGDFTAIAKGK